MCESQVNLARKLVEEETRNKLSAVELSLQKLTNRVLELDLLEVIAQESAAKLEAKEKEVAEEMQKLDQLQYERWESRNDFSDKIWKFSTEHDLCALFNRYLDTPKRVPRKFLPFDENQHPDVVKAKAEVKELKNELLNKNTVVTGLEEKIMQAKIQLQISKSYRNRDREIIRLKNSIDGYQEKYYDIESKIATIRTNSVNWQNPIMTPLTKRHFITASELIAREKIEEDTIKRPRFSVKIESAISRKLSTKRNSLHSN